MSRMFVYADAIESLCPGSEWTIYGNDPDQIIWHKPPALIPTKDELVAEVARLQADYDAKLYQRQRAPEYPPLSDLADALYWQAQGNMEPMNRYMAACEAVKAKYPKGNTNG